MAAPKYIASLPSEEASIGEFFFINGNLINKHVSKVINGLTVPQLRILQALKMVSKQRRKLYIGVAQWFRNSPSGGKSYIYRRREFEEAITILEAKGYIEIVAVPCGKVARVTDAGLYICSQVAEFLQAYYRRIFTQFNLIPVI
jgi:hypothetical protein